MNTIALKFCPITVDDVDAAIPFYRDGLGLDLVNDVESDGHRWVSLGFSGQAGILVVLSDPGAGRSADDGDALHRLIAKGSGPGPFGFSSDDLDATYERVAATGVEVLQEPKDQPWGPRDCAFRDPSGNHIRISQAE